MLTSFCFAAGFFLACAATMFLTENPGDSIGILGLLDVARAQLGLLLGFCTIGIWMFGVGSFVVDHLYHIHYDEEDEYEEKWGEDPV